MSTKFSATRRIQPTPKVCKSKALERWAPKWPPPQFFGYIQADIETYNNSIIRLDNLISLYQIAWDQFRWTQEITIESAIVTVSFRSPEPRNYFTIEVLVHENGIETYAAGIEDQKYTGPDRYDTYLLHLRDYAAFGPTHCRIMQ